MCFSAGASFGASIVLGAVGIATIKKASSSNQIPFASIPLLFAGQQVAEGALWIGLSTTSDESWKHFPVYIFLIFAQLVWPVWIPLSIFLLEKDRTRKTIIKMIVGFGTGISLYLMYCLFVYPVKAEIHSGHILYMFSFPIAYRLDKQRLVFYCDGRSAICVECQKNSVTRLGSVSIVYSD